jgi:erythromycin esterase
VLVLVRTTILLSLVACSGPVATVPRPFDSSPVEVDRKASRRDARQARDAATLVISVHDASGTPIADALITYTAGEDDATPVVRATNSRGEVEFEKRESGSVTVMTPSGFGIATVDAKTGDSVKIVLDGRCEVFHGLVHDQSATSASPAVDLVQVFRYGAPIGQAFSAKADADGQFKGCLPQGRYFVDSELDEVGGGVLFELPTDEPIDYVATRESSAKTEPPLELLPEASLEAMVRGVPRDAGVIALGESTHGTAEFALERARFTIELAKTRKVRFVLLEASFGETLALDRYVRNGTGDVRKAVAALRFWMWDTEEFIQSVELIRAFNRTRPSKDRIGILGTDVQMAGGAVAFLLEDGLRKLSSEDRAALANVPDIDASKWSELPDGEKQEVRAVLARLAVHRHPHDMHALAAASIVARLDDIVVGPELESMRVRDRLMAEMTLRISQEGKELSVVWAHMGHITKRWMFGQETMGGRLHARLGPKYVAFALLGASGSARAWDAESKVGVIPHVLDPAPRYSVEGALSKGRKDTQYVLFSTLPPQLQTWISNLRYVRFLGSTFPVSGGGWALYDVGHGFDGAVVFPSTSATTPTATGVRKAKAP